MNALARMAQNALAVCEDGALGLNSPMPSPCVSVCQMDPALALCSGCLRSIDEISRWSRMDDGGKREVWKLIAERATRALELS